MTRHLPSWTLSLWISGGVLGGLSTAGGESVFEHPSWSPDGERLAFAAEVQGSKDLFSTCVDGSGPIRLTALADDASYPHWGADGRSIVFHVGHADRSGFELRLLHLDGGEIEALVTAVSAFEPTLSPDGGSVLFTARGSEGLDIYALDLSTGESAPRITSPGDQQMAHWRSDGTIYYQSRIETDWEIWRLSSDSGTPERVLSEEGWSLQHPSIDGSGSLMVFDRQRSDDATRSSREIAAVKLTALTDLLRITDNRVRDGYPKISPEGRRVVFHRRTGGRSILVLSEDGSERVLPIDLEGAPSLGSAGLPPCGR